MCIMVFGGCNRNRHAGWDIFPNLPSIESVQWVSVGVFNKLRPRERCGCIRNNPIAMVHCYRKRDMSGPLRSGKDVGCQGNAE